MSGSVLVGVGADGTKFVNKVKKDMHAGANAAVIRVATNYAPGTKFEAGLLAPMPFSGLAAGVPMTDAVSPTASFEKMSGARQGVVACYKVTTTSGSIYHVMILQ